MSNPYVRAPHVGDRHFIASDSSPHAALLIDFDNVTMGRGSDLTKELRTLLNSEIIKGKVAVQRAYADWRRYPQYIVPLSEASIDLIFAPAYGSSKKNATDIRMAIDALELIFIRPEIGTFILLTGDSDFSSVVLKLKEYGKYVIGVGIQESSSDILVQNCDEYYSYTSLTGLTKTSEAERAQFDPWVLVAEAISKMVQRGDVMRSDRLKQVMREIDKGFSENEHGFPKFSKFLAEASHRGLVNLRKMENGQYEVSPGRKKARRGRRGARQESASSTPSSAPTPGGDPLERAYSIVRNAMGDLAGDGRGPARDSDVKRRILVLEPQFDEAELGFPKFSLFLKQAEQDGVVELSRKEPEGYTEVTLGERQPASDDGDADEPLETSPMASAEAPRSRGRRTRPRRGSEEAATAEAVPDAAAEAEARNDRSDRDERDERGGRGRGDRDRDRDRGRGRGSGRGRGRGQSEPSTALAAPTPHEVTTPTPHEVATPTPHEVTTPTAHEVAAATPQEVASRATRDVAWPSEHEIAAGPPPKTAESTKPDPTPTADVPATPTQQEPSAKPSAETSSSRALHPRQASRRRGPEGPPPIMEGQGVTLGSRGGSGSSSDSTPGNGAPLAGLPADPGAIERYLTHRYKGVGEKTAQQVVAAFGSETFSVLDQEPHRVTEILSEHRAEALLEAWAADKGRRSGSDGGS